MMEIISGGNESRGIVSDLGEAKIFDIEDPMDWVSTYSLSELEL
jgi:hypothetical protein